MSADRLREAARVLREHAQAATPGPWRANGSTYGPRGTRTHWSIGTADATGDGGVVESAYGGADAAYIALMAPPVALALTDWLDAEADQIDGYDGRSVDAEAVADAILGGAR